MRIIGSGGGGGGSEQASRAPVEAPDSLASKATARILDLLGEGEIEGLVNGLKSVYLDETPVQAADGSMNFPGVSVTIRNGAQDQAYIPGFEVQEREIAVGVKITAATPVVRQIADSLVSQARITVGVPGLSYSDNTTGDLSGASVSLRISVQSSVGGYVDLLEDTISGKTRSRYQRSYRIDLPGTGPWNIKVTRLSADSTTASLVNNLYWDSYTEIIDAKLRYPNSAMAGVMLDAAQFSSVPERGYHVKLTRVKVPSNYDPISRTYSGVWDGAFVVAWTNNPAWCFYDILTNRRYGLGAYVPPALADKWTLYQIGKYCDEIVPDGFGGFEPRFTCNVYIQGQQDAYKVLNDFASVFRGMAYWSAGAVFATQDAPSDPVMLFNASNVTDGMFTREGSGRKARHTVAVVAWNDKNDFFRLKPEYVEDAEGVKRYGIRKADVTAFACSSQGQAHRIGRWLLFTEKYESDLISWGAGMDAAFLTPGKIVKIIDPARSTARWGGRVVSATSNSVTLDKAVTLAGGSQYTLSVMMPNGTLVDRIVDNPPGLTNVIEFNLVLPSTDIAQATWGIGSSELAPEFVRVLSVVEDGPIGYKIVGLEHYPGKYAAVEQDLILTKPKTSDLRVAPGKVTNVAGSEYLYKQGGAVRVRLVIGFEAAPGGIRYQVSYARADGNWISLTPSSATSYEVDDVVPDTYSFRVVAINAIGQYGQVVEGSYTVKGKEGLPPEDVTGFTVQKYSSFLQLRWNPVSDLDVAGYEIRSGASWDAGTLLVTGLAGTSYAVSESSAGLHTYYIRAIDTTGNYSENATAVAITLVAPDPVSNFDCVQSQNRLELYWDENPETELSGYEVREGTSWDTSMLVSSVTATALSVPAGSSGNRTFWIKAIAYPGVYSLSAVFVTTAVALPADRNVIFTSDQAALGFPNTAHNATAVSTQIEMDPTVDYSEYLFDVDLGYSVRAQNSARCLFDSIAADNRVWNNATFAWDSPDALAPWEIAGDSKAVSARLDIATRAGLAAGETEGFRLNGSLISVNGLAPSTAVGVDYGPGRYGQGVKVEDATDIQWTYALPAQFRTHFWIRMPVPSNRVVWRATGASGLLLYCAYDAVNHQFVLQDNNSNVVALPFVALPNDQICVGIAQTATDRRLFACRMRGVPTYATEAFPAPAANYTTIALK